MSAAVTLPPLVSQPETKTLFMARRSELRLVKTPIYPIFGPIGQKVGEHRGETIQFRDGVFRCPTEGTVTLVDGREVDAAPIHEWLMNHQLNGDLWEGFWAVDPVAPPVSEDEMKAIMVAGIELDDGKLVALIEQESAGWNRQQVLATATDALERIRDVKARAQAEAEAAVAAKAKPKA